MSEGCYVEGYPGEPMTSVALEIKIELLEDIMTSTDVNEPSLDAKGVNANISYCRV
ncbi:hypothetical protein V6N11_039471 [Hibiscus sabdariffa]|uniref:Uncharacterized protein n=1 Tax=Hibiscus sabdariffa TaxID=183260 RepID=A0ABR2SN42_9ROSI